MVVSWIIDVFLALVVIGFLMAGYYKKRDRGMMFILAALVVGILDSFVMAELGVVVPPVWGTAKDLLFYAVFAYGPFIVISFWIGLVDWVHDRYCLPGEPLLE